MLIMLFNLLIFTARQPDPPLVELCGRKPAPAHGEPSTDQSISATQNPDTRELILASEKLINSEPIPIPQESDKLTFIASRNPKTNKAKTDFFDPSKQSTSETSALTPEEPSHATIPQDSESSFLKKALSRVSRKLGPKRSTSVTEEPFDMAGYANEKLSAMPIRALDCGEANLKRYLPSEPDSRGISRGSDAINSEQQAPGNSIPVSTPGYKRGIIPEVLNKASNWLDEERNRELEKSETSKRAFEDNERAKQRDAEDRDREKQEWNAASW